MWKAPRYFTACGTLQPSHHVIVMICIANQVDMGRWKRFTVDERIHWECAKKLFRLSHLCQSTHKPKHTPIHATAGGAEGAVAACLGVVSYNCAVGVGVLMLAYDMLTNVSTVQPDTSTPPYHPPSYIKPNPHNVIFVRQTSKHQKENRSRRIGRLSRQFTPNMKKGPMPSCASDDNCCPMPWFIAWRQRTCPTPNENPLYLC